MKSDKILVVRPKPLHEVEEKPETILKVVGESEKKLSIDDKIAKVEAFKILVDKREKLLQSRRKLENFVLGSDGQTELLTLKDSNGQTFQTSNSLAVNEVLEVLKSNLNHSIVEIESKIEF